MTILKPQESSDDWDTQPTRISAAPETWETAPTTISPVPVSSHVDRNREDIEAALFGDDRSGSRESSGLNHVIDIQQLPHEDVEEYLFSDRNDAPAATTGEAYDEAVSIHAADVAPKGNLTPEDAREFQKMMAERARQGGSEQTSA